MNEVTASNGLVTRCLMRTELPALWTIDRRERVDEVYAVVDGQLTLRREFYDTRGWPEGEPESQAPLLLACFDRGGIFRGVFDGGAWWPPACSIAHQWRIGRRCGRWLFCMSAMTGAGWGWPLCCMTVVWKMSIHLAGQACISRQPPRAGRWISTVPRVLGWLLARTGICMAWSRTIFI